MSLLVLGYPNFRKEDFEWIQGIRSKYDTRYYNVVNPHFTMVFPVTNFVQGELIKDVIKNCSGLKKISFNLRCSVIVKDSFSTYTDVFLIPDEGYSNLVKLHDRLYSGILKNELRLDIPFIPHIGVGGSINPMESKIIAEGLNKSNFAIDGLLNKLDIVSYNYPDVETVKEIYLL